MDVSDDEGDEGVSEWARTPVDVSAASQALAIKWLRTARSSLLKRGTGEDSSAVVRKRKPGEKSKSKRK